MDWNVKNANSRDVERQQLNKILKEVEAALAGLDERLTSDRGSTDIRDVIGDMVTNNVETGITVTYDPVKKVINFVVPTRAVIDDPEEPEEPVVDTVEEAPLDGESYTRQDGLWVPLDPRVRSLRFVEGPGLLAITSYDDWEVRVLQGVDGEIDVTFGDAEDGDPTIGLADLADSGEGALLAITRDSKGRVSGTKEATITGTAGNIEVTDGDAVAGLPTIDLADVSDSGLGQIQGFEKDSKGRVTGTRVVTTDDLDEGSTNLYFTAARVRGTLLAGLSLASSAVIAASDTVLQALGKLQAQVSGKEPSITSGTTGQFWRGDKVFTDELIGSLHVIQDYLPGGEHGIEVSMDASVAGSLTHASVTSTTYGLQGGGTFHGRGARGTRASPSPVLSGDNFGGIGGRPYHSGGEFFHSSPVSAHWIAKEDMTTTGAGSCWRMLTTKVGQPQSQRKITAVFADDGDFIIGEYDNNPIAVLGGRGLVVVRENSPVEQTQISYGASGFSAGVRFVTCRGTVASPQATQSADGAFFGLGGHDGVNYQTAAAAGVFFQAFNNWSPTSRPATITFSTTTDGTTTRVARWYVWHTGEFLPAQDNIYDVGGPINRVRTVYAGTGTINTSDAREKSNIRDLTPQELAAASDLAVLARLYQWNEAIAEKGANARLHCSPTVQSVIACMESHGLDPFRYGFVCHDEWAEQPEIRDEETGEVTQEYRPAGDRYSLRPCELQFFIARGQEERLRRLEEAVNITQN